MKRLIIQRLTLTGFGLYRDKVDVSFPESLGVLIGPNERGKSTIISGLSAVLFGLPASNNPNEFGMTRFRNHLGPQEFWGEIELLLEDVQYRLWRSFDNHRIRLSRFQGDGWVDEVVGEHNPRASKPNAPFLAWLEDLFGHASRELFEATFCLTQARSENDSISEELQSLLTGSVSGGYQESLQRLVDRARTLTKATKSVGISRYDGRKAGRLDELRKEMEALRERIADSTISVDEVRRLTEEENEKSAALADLRTKLDRLKRTQAAVQDWRHLKQRVSDRQSQAIRLSQSIDRYRTLADKVHQLNEERQSLYPEFESAPEGIEKVWPVLQELDRLAKQVAHVKAQEKIISQELAETEQELGEALRWHSQGSAVSWVEHMQNAWRSVVRQWQDFNQVREEWRTLNEKRQSEFAPFEEAAPAMIEYVRTYREKRLSLELQLSRAKEDLRSQKAELKRLEDHDERLSRPLQLMKASSILLVGIGALSIGEALFLGRIPYGLLTALVFIASAALVWWNPWARKMRSEQQSIAGRRNEFVTEKLAQSEGNLKEFDEALQVLESHVETPKEYFGDLEDAYSRWSELCRQSDELERTMKRMVFQWGLDVPMDWNSVELVDLKTLGEVSWKDFIRGMDALGQLGPSPTLGDVVQSAEKVDAEFWEGLSQRAATGDALRQKQSELTARRTHLVGVQAEGDSPKGPRGGELGRLMGDIDALISQLDGSESGEWFRVKQAAQTGQVDVLFDQVAPDYHPIFAAADHDLKQVLRRWEQWKAAAAEAERCQGEQEAMLKALAVASPEELEKLRLRTQTEYEMAIRDIQELLEKHPGLAALEAQENIEGVNENIEKISSELKQIEDRVQQHEEAIFNLRGRISELQGKNPLNVAEAELNLVTLQEEEERLRFELEALVMAHEELNDVGASFYLDHSGRLAKAVSAHYSTLTDRPGRQVRFDENMKVLISEANGSTFTPAQLSQGARDQLYLALRFAVADLLTKGFRIPFILDDPFVTYDEERLRLVRESLVRLSKERQVILLSHRQEWDSWGESIVVCDSKDYVSEGVER